MVAWCGIHARFEAEVARSQQSISTDKDDEEKEKGLEQEWLRQQAKDEEQPATQGFADGALSPEARVEKIPKYQKKQAKQANKKAEKAKKAEMAKEEAKNLQKEKEEKIKKAKEEKEIRAKADREKSHRDYRKWVEDIWSKIHKSKEKAAAQGSAGKAKANRHVAAPVSQAASLVAKVNHEVNQSR